MILSDAMLVISKYPVIPYDIIVLKLLATQDRVQVLPAKKKESICVPEGLNIVMAGRHAG